MQRAAVVAEHVDDAGADADARAPPYARQRPAGRAGGVAEGVKGRYRPFGTKEIYEYTRSISALSIYDQYGHS